MEIIFNYSNYYSDNYTCMLILIWFFEVEEHSIKQMCNRCDVSVLLELATAFALSAIFVFHPFHFIFVAIKVSNKSYFSLFVNIVHLLFVRLCVGWPWLLIQTTHIGCAVLAGPFALHPAPRSSTQSIETERAKREKKNNLNANILEVAVRTRTSMHTYTHGHQWSSSPPSKANKVSNNANNAIIRHYLAFSRHKPHRITFVPFELLSSSLNSRVIWCIARL